MVATWLRRLVSRQSQPSRHPAARTPSSRRPQLEALEDRCVPSASLVANLSYGATSSSPHDLAVVGGKVFFAATQAIGVGTELYKSDGTTAGTGLVKDISVGGRSSPEHL